MRAKGSGLGLFIVRSVARKHGGRAFAESEGPGHGSTFTLLLPQAAERLRRDRTPQRVLIVEDEQHLAEGLRFNLEAEGYRRRSRRHRRGGAGAAARQRPAPFDLVVLDVMLPGKDGFTVVAELREARQFVPVLMLTARGRPEDVLKGFAAGADDYLPKPTELAILLARIGGLLRRSRWLRRGAGSLHVRGQDHRLRHAGAAGRRSHAAAHADGSQPASLSDRARRQGGVAQVHAGGGLGRARGHRHARHRQLHRAGCAATSRRSRRGREHLLTVRGVGYRFVRRARIS